MFSVCFHLKTCQRSQCLCLVLKQKIAEAMFCRSLKPTIFEFFLFLALS